MPTASKAVSSPMRIAAVSFLNTRPLVHGLDQDPACAVVYDVPARLPGLLHAGAAEVALVPVVDLLEAGNAWRIVSDACIGCSGETLTVRVFCRVAPARVRTLHVDGDSHTSVLLARLLWRELFGCELRLEAYTGREPAGGIEAVLLIGDKVIRQATDAFPAAVDLGAAWQSLTGLPFVFAVWAGAADRNLSGVAARLSRARDEGVRVARRIARTFGPRMGWPVDLARSYLTRHLQFTLTEHHQAGMQRFFGLLARHGLAAAPELACT
ncbi:MAG TPA: menaquinone biosynthesis protein [Phycisphaerae bacterium]|nr:menaquinone biosynthesis protein [Phycisphaerae bacterium]HNU43896.1 menaquinone biosynthesis protein [Phycisphaerae bacterium]